LQPLHSAALHAFSEKLVDRRHARRVRAKACRCCDTPSKIDYACRVRKWCNPYGAGSRTPAYPRNSLHAFSEKLVDQCLFLLQRLFERAPELETALKQIASHAKLGKITEKPARPDFCDNPVITGLSLNTVSSDNPV